jgi:hypothetical protein
MEVEFVKIEHDLTRKNDLMNLWFKAGSLPAKLPSHWAVYTYFTTCEGQLGIFNPTVKKGGAGLTLDFEWMLEATPENRDKLLAEVQKRYDAGRDEKHREMQARRQARLDAEEQRKAANEAFRKKIPEIRARHQAQAAAVSA